MAAGSGARATGGGLEQDRNEFRRIVTSLNDQIDADGKDGRGALHKDAEAIYMRLLNALFGWELADANPPGRSAKAIDLIDRKRRIVVQVTSECSSRKISDETIAKMNGALESGEEVPYRGGPDGPYRLKFAFVGREDKTRRGGARERWRLEEPRGFEFDRVTDTIFTSDLTHAFKDLAPARRAEVLELARGDVGRIGFASLAQSRDGISDDLINRINENLKQKRKNHPSFRLLNSNPIEELLPKGETGKRSRFKGVYEKELSLQRQSSLIPNSDRAVRLAGGKELISFKQFFQDSWSKGEQNHLYIIGKGGVGKTIALLTFATEEGFLPKGVAAIYIPLYELPKYVRKKSNCINRYLRKHFKDKAVYKMILRLSNEPWDKGPRLILLLDGHNELPVNPSMRFRVDDDIAEWAEKPGVQIVAASRDSGLPRIRMNYLELVELSNNEVRSVLSERSRTVPNLVVPKANDPLMRVLTTPLMLKIYVDVASFEERCDAHWLQMKTPDNVSRLVWNYLQIELYNQINKDIVDEPRLDFASAIMLVLPYVCWRMECDGNFDINKEALLRVVSDACEYWDGKKRRPASYAVVASFEDDEQQADGAGAKVWSHLDCYRLQRVLTKGSALLKRQNNVFALAHQNFRDVLAAVHILNAVETMQYDIPAELKGYVLSDNVKDYISEIISEEDLNILWKENNKNGRKNPIATYNLLRIACKLYNGNLEYFDFSNADLREVDIYGLIHPFRPTLPRNARMFEKTSISANSFRPRGHTAPVSTVCFSPDGKIVASGSYDGTVRIWAARDLRGLNELAVNHGLVCSVCFSPDGKMLVGGTSDGSIITWDVHGSMASFVVSEHSDWVSSLCFSGDGRLLAAGSYDGTVSIWKVVTNTLRVSSKPLILQAKTRPNRSSSVRSVSFSPDGKSIAFSTINGDVVCCDLLNVQGLKMLKRFSKCVNSICFSPDGRTLACGGFDGCITLWDAATCRMKSSFTGHNDKIRSVCFSSTSTVIASGSDDDAVRLWNVEDGSLIAELKGHTDWIRSISFHPTEYQLLSGADDGAIVLWDCSKLEQMAKTEGHSGSVGSVCYSTDGRMLAGGLYDTSVRIWDVDDDYACKHILLEHTDWVRAVCFSPDKRLFASGCDDKAVLVRDSDSYMCVKRLDKLPDWVSSACFSADGTILACGLHDGSICLWNTDSFDDLRVLKVHTTWVMSLAFSPEGNILASGSDDGTVCIWDAGEGVLLRRVRSGAERVRSVCFAPDGRTLAGGTSSGSIILWDTDTLETIAHITEHSDWVSSVCFSHNGRMLAAGSYDGKISVWDTSGLALCALDGVKLKRIEVFDSNSGFVRSACFSPDDKHIACGTGVGNLVVWDVNRRTIAQQIEPLYGIDLCGLDFSRAEVPNSDREVFIQNGVKVPPETSIDAISEQSSIE